MNSDAVIMIIGAYNRVHRYWMWRHSVTCDCIIVTKLGTTGEISDATAAGTSPHIRHTFLRAAQIFRNIRASRARTTLYTP